MVGSWEDRRINDFFDSNKTSDKKWVTYSQLVAPDTLATERMIGATISKSKENFMIVLDSGAIEDLGRQYYSEGDVHRILLTEKGITNPTRLDWIKYWLRGSQQTTVPKEDYETGVAEERYPPSSFLKKGYMLIFEK